MIVSSGQYLCAGLRYRRRSPGLQRIAGYFQDFRSYQDRALAGYSELAWSYRRYKASPAVAAWQTFDDRDHWLIGEPGWDEITGYIEGWLHGLPNK